MPEELEAIRATIADLSRRVGILETRGSDTAVTSLHKIDTLTVSFTDFHTKLDNLISCVEKLRAKGCSLAELHASKITDIKQLANEAYDMAQKSMMESTKAMAIQAIITAVVTALMVFGLNLAVSHI